MRTAGRLRAGVRALGRGAAHRSSAAFGKHRVRRRPRAVTAVRGQSTELFSLPMELIRL